MIQLFSAAITVVFFFLPLQLDNQRAEESGPTVCWQQPGPRDQHVRRPRPLQARLQGWSGGWQYRRKHPGDGL